jgi:diguanylate cyclase (GGDEF)-like protein
MAARADRVASRPIRRAGRRLRAPREPEFGQARRLGPGLIRALDGLPHGLCVFDAADRLLFVSAGFRRLFGQRAQRIRPGMHAREVGALSAIADLRGAPGRSGLQPLPDGRQVALTTHPQAGGGWAILVEDVTERRRAETLLRYMAHHDPLTGLPNRYRFAARLDRALDRGPAGPGIGPCALLCIDLDGFKPVNDRYGHALGDALLQQLAGRLQQDLGEADLAARLGGDEFAILLGGAAPAQALAFARRLHARLAEPYDLGAGAPIRAAAAIGIACAPLHATRAKALAERADAAMYEAKRRGQPCLWDVATVLGTPAGAASQP